MMTGIRINVIIKMLREYEDHRKHPYRCSAGYLSIGVGRNLDTKGLSDKEILYLLENDIDDCIHSVATKLPWAKDAKGEIQEVLVMMCFQMGIGGLLEFKKFLKALEAKDYEKAAKEGLDSKWATSDSPKRAREMMEIIRSGQV